MKKGLVIIIFIASLVLLLFPKSRTPYSGIYSCVGNSNYTLELKPNNKFTIHYDMAKNTEEAEGTYTVNNNHIKLQYTDKKSFLSKDFVYSGVVYGEDIIFSSSVNSHGIEFDKL